MLFEEIKTASETEDLGPKGLELLWTMRYVYTKKEGA
jgi:hypothetical protein